MTVLVLGGTAQARRLAAALHAEGVPVVTSLAGEVAAPRLPPGEVRTGGFGGAGGLAAWLAEHRIGAVVDATHPFAATMGANAAAACARTGVPLLRLERPAWQPAAGDRWHRVATMEQAAGAVAALGAGRVLLALGRRHVAAFAGLEGVWFLIRAVGAPQPPLPAAHTVYLARGPFTLDGERALLDEHAIDLVVTRDSGGDGAKLVAARERGLPVVLVDRPARPRTLTVATVGQAQRWARSVRAPAPRR